MRKSVEDWVEANSANLVAMSDEIWGYAELGLVEHKSAKLQMDYLRAQGFQVESGIGGMDAAFIASWGSQKPVIGFLGEYDAVPMVSNKPVPYQEPIVQGGPGHGCGHNLLGVGSVGAACALKALAEERGFQGTIRYYGCPAEESSFGKTWMARDGAFDDVDIALTWHPGSTNNVRNSTSLADLVYKFDFYGKTAHASGSPWNGRSALDGVELMNAGVERMREHMRPESRIHYVISYGGGAPNVVPDHAQSFFDIRAADLDELKRMFSWVSDIAQGAALMTQTKYEPRFLGAAANSVPNLVLSKVLHEAMETIGAPQWDAKELEFAGKIQSQFPPEFLEAALAQLGEHASLLGQTRLCDIIIPYSDKIVGGSGSTDVGDVSWIAPTGECTTACNPFGIPGHSWAVVASSGTGIGHKGLLYAAKILGLAGARLMTEPDLVSSAKADWEQRLNGRKYVTPIPSNIAKPPLPFE